MAPWLDGRWPFWTLTLFDISDVNFDLFSFYIALSAFSEAFDFRCVMFSLRHAFRLHFPSSLRVTAPCIPWLTPSSPTQSSHSYPRLVYAPLIFHPTASDGLVSPLPFRLGYWSASFSSMATAALTPLVASFQSPNSGCWLDGRWPFWTLTLFGISDVNFDLFSFYLALSAFSVAFDFRCVMFSLHHALRLRS